MGFRVGTVNLCMYECVFVIVSKEIAHFVQWHIPNIIKSVKLNECFNKCTNRHKLIQLEYLL